MKLECVLNWSCLVYPFIRIQIINTNMYWWIFYSNASYLSIEHWINMRWSLKCSNKSHQIRNYSGLILYYGHFIGLVTPFSFIPSKEPSCLWFEVCHSFISLIKTALYSLNFPKKNKNKCFFIWIAYSSFWRGLLPTLNI